MESPTVMGFLLVDTTFSYNQHSKYIDLLNSYSNVSLPKRIFAIRGFNFIEFHYKVVFST